VERVERIMFARVAPQQEHTGSPQPSPSHRCPRALALSRTATRACAGAKRNACRWHGDLPPRECSRPVMLHAQNLLPPTENASRTCRPRTGTKVSTIHRLAPTAGDGFRIGAVVPLLSISARNLPPRRPRGYDVGGPTWT